MVKWAPAKYTPPASAQEQEVREQDLIRALHAPWKKKPKQLDLGGLPRQVIELLAAYLPQKGLKAFLQRHPNIFTIYEQGGGKWTFSIL